MDQLIAHTMGSLSNLDRTNVTSAYRHLWTFGGVMAKTRYTWHTRVALALHQIQRTIDKANSGPEKKRSVLFEISDAERVAINGTLIWHVRTLLQDGIDDLPSGDVWIMMMERCAVWTIVRLSRHPDQLVDSMTICSELRGIGGHVVMRRRERMHFFQPIVHAFKAGGLSPLVPLGVFALIYPSTFDEDFGRAIVNQINSYWYQCARREQSAGSVYDQATSVAMIFLILCRNDGEIPTHYARAFGDACVRLQAMVNTFVTNDERSTRILDQVVMVLSMNRMVACNWGLRISKPNGRASRSPGQSIDTKDDPVLYGPKYIEELRNARAFVTTALRMELMMTIATILDIHEPNDEGGKDWANVPGVIVNVMGKSGSVVSRNVGTAMYEASLVLRERTVGGNVAQFPQIDEVDLDLMSSMLTRYPKHVVVSDTEGLQSMSHMVVTIDSSRAISLVCAANELGIDVIVNTVESALCRALTMRNIESVHLVAKSLSLGRLMMCCDIFLLQHPGHVKTDIDRLAVATMAQWIMTMDAEPTTSLS